MDWNEWRHVYRTDPSKLLYMLPFDRLRWSERYSFRSSLVNSIWQLCGAQVSLSGSIEVFRNESSRSWRLCRRMLETSSCVSLNTASSRDQENRFWCELLLSDMFNNSENFRDNATSHHFSKWVSLYNIDVTDIKIRSFDDTMISINVKKSLIGVRLNSVFFYRTSDE